MQYMFLPNEPESEFAKRNDPDSVEQIAAAVGYADGVTLRTLLRTRLGRGVREIRDRAAG